jgi:electron transfer flavoprotein beta subunit
MIVATIVKHVPDAEARLEAHAGRVLVDASSLALDGMDEYGVEEAVRMKEAGVAHEVVALALGGEGVEAALRSALALGADRAILLKGDSELDPVAQSAPLADAVRGLGATLVLVGGKQADWDSAALGAAVAERLGWPLCDWATEVHVAEGRVRIRHDVDDGQEWWEAPLPVVITTQQGLNEPRYPTLPNIMKAKRKPLDVVAVDAPMGVVQRDARLPKRARLGVKLEGTAVEVAEALVVRLREEAKVI